LCGLESIPLLYSPAISAVRSNRRARRRESPTRGKIRHARFRADGACQTAATRGAQPARPVLAQTRR